MRGKGKSKTVSQEGPKRRPWSGKCHQDERCEREGRGQDSDQTLGEGDCISPDEEVAGRAGDELRSRNVKFEVFTGRPGDVKPAVGYVSLHFGGEVRPRACVTFGSHQQTDSLKAP